MLQLPVSIQAVRRQLLLFLACTLVLSAGTVPTHAQSASEPAVPATEMLAGPVWAAVTDSTTLRSQPDDGAEIFATLRPQAPLQILGYAGDWAYVYNPRTKGTAYVSSALLAPADAPSAYAEADPPAVQDELEQNGWVAQDTPLAFYPTADPAAAYTDLPAGAAVEVTARVEGDDGQDWYRTADGDYLPVSAVDFPSPPATPVFSAAAPTARQTYGGNWIDVNLNLPAHLTAYAGSTPVRSMLVIIGRGPMATPTGTFSILRRVANETMDSATVGIPRRSAGGYYLTGVLFTQYFLPGGQSIHYNYWSSNWGYPGSHGCLGLSYSDAAYVWDFVGVGSTVAIHY
jgi:lipoprotein-anchoring transpeptidase ErfK/SrfK